MLSLYIDNQEASLMDDMTLEYIRENPLFKANGDYTYDIDLDLKNAANKKLYLGLQRLNNKFNISGRTAVLKDGNKVIIGTEVILSVDSDMVKIQIVSNNSELNYLAGSSKVKIRELDLGKIDAVSHSVATANVDKVYPEVKYAFPQVTLADDYESSTNSQRYNVPNPFTTAGGGFEYDTRFPLRPQPFLMYYVEKVVEVLGYKMKSNFLNTMDKWKRLIMVNRYDTLEFAKMLPDWTTAEFISEVEHFFNGVFVVDSANKEVCFISVAEYSKNDNFVYIDNDSIIDDFDIEMDEKDSDTYYLSTRSAEYELPSNNRYWKMAGMDAETFAKCEIVEGWPNTETWDKWILYKIPERERYVKPFRFVYEYGNGSTSINYLLYEARQYAASDDEDNRLRLKICPSRVSWHMATDFYVYFGLVSDELELSEENVGFWDSIDNGETTDEISSCMNVAFYAGRRMVFAQANSTIRRKEYQLPMAFCNYWTQNDGMGGFSHFNDDEFPGCNKYMTMELDGERGRIANDFNNNIYIDKTCKYTVRFVTNKVLDPMNVYVIHNRRFACKQLKYQWQNCQCSGVVEGEFYPLNA